MGKIIDITGETFGKWTVLKQDPERTSSGNVRWICKCECGTIRSVEGSRLRSGKSLSCGCREGKKIEKRKTIDLTGQQINSWTVLERIKIPGKKNATYKCRCACGIEKIVEGRHLKDGSSKSCGCSRKINNSSVKDLIGQRFGKLVVTERYGSDDKSHALWKCKCDCGNSCIKNSKHLISLSTVSCGCETSAGESLIENLLKELNLTYQRQVTFPELRGDTNLLRFDFGILDPKYSSVICLIEYQGEQHYQPCFGLGEEELRKQQRYDQKKLDYAKDHTIPLIIIPYWDKTKLNIDYLKSLLGQELFI